MNRKYRILRYFQALNGLTAFIVTLLALSMLCTLSPAYGGGGELDGRMTNEELSSSLGTPIDKLESWEPCYKAYREYNWRIRQWRRIVEKGVAEKKLLKDDFEKIDFSLPGDPDFGDEPEVEFFNPHGNFRADPMPQGILDELSEVKGSRLIFNTRKWYETWVAELSGLPPHFRTALIVIAPNFIPSCSKGGRQIWEEDTFKIGTFAIEPNNHSVVEDRENTLVNMRVTPDGKRYYWQLIAFR